MVFFGSVLDSDGRGLAPAGVFVGLFFGCASGGWVGVVVGVRGSGASRLASTLRNVMGASLIGTRQSPWNG